MHRVNSWGHKYSENLDIIAIFFIFLGVQRQPLMTRFDFFFLITRWDHAYWSLTSINYLLHVYDSNTYSRVNWRSVLALWVYRVESLDYKYGENLYIITIFLFLMQMQPVITTYSFALFIFIFVFSLTCSLFLLVFFNKCTMRQNWLKPIIGPV